MLGARIGRLAAESAAARVAIAQTPEAAGASLSAIENEGRQTLAEMREIVGGLSDENRSVPSHRSPTSTPCLRGLSRPTCA